MTRIFLFLIAAFILAVSFTPVLAEDKPDLFSPENYCHDSEAWKEWEALVRKYPKDFDLQALHALRIGLCTKIDQGTVSLEDAIRIFDRAHKMVIEGARSKGEGQAPEL
jgi:hypothetical protein